MPQLMCEIRPGDRIVWRLQQVGFSSGKVITITPEGWIRVQQDPRNANQVQLNTQLKALQRVVGVVCPECGTGDHKQEEGWLARVVIGSPLRWCPSCGYKEE